MKFDCGETYNERRCRQGCWHQWFAWYPVKIKDHDCRWLEVVWRRRWSPDYSWEYATGLVKPLDSYYEDLCK